MVTFSESSKSFIKLFHLLPSSETFTEVSIFKVSLYAFLLLKLRDPKPLLSGCPVYCFTFASVKKGKEKKTEKIYHMNRIVTWKVYLD